MNGKGKFKIEQPTNDSMSSEMVDKDKLEAALSALWQELDKDRVELPSVKFLLQ